MLVWLPLDLLAIGWAGMLGGLKEPELQKARRHRMDMILVGPWFAGFIVAIVVFCLYLANPVSGLFVSISGPLNIGLWAIFAVVVGSGILIPFTQSIRLKGEALRSMRRRASKI